MSISRPNAVVYQEYEDLTTIPDSPDLEVVIVGTCKQLLDYLDDKDECYATTYGTYQENCPASTAVAVTISDPPNIVAGGVLDSTAVKMYFDEAEVIIVASPTPLSTSAGGYDLGDNLFTANTSAGGTHFGNSGVAAGDTLIVENAGTNNYIMTVKELCYTLYDSSGTLNFQDATDPVQEGDTVTLTNDTAATSRDGVYTVKRVVGANTLEVTSATWTGVYGGATTADISITDANGTPRTAASGTGKALNDYCRLRTTSDFLSTATGMQWRVERTASDVELARTDFSISGNAVTVNSGITVDLSSTLTGKTVSYAKIYMEYAAFRTDLRALKTLSNTTEIETALGKYDSRNPLCVGAIIAKANTSTSIKIYGVATDTLAAYTDFLDRISSERNVYAIVPLTYSTSVLAAINDSCENMANPTYVLDHGIKQKFRVCIGAVELETRTYLVNATGGATPTTKDATAPVGNKQGTMTSTGGTLPNVFTYRILPGDVFEIYDSTGPTTTSYTVVQTNNDYIFESSSVITTASLSNTGDYIRFTRNGAEITGTKVTVNGTTITAVGITAAALDNLYLVLSCPKAHFITDGVIAGDILEIPYNPTSSTWTGTTRTFVINEVNSEQKLTIVNILNSNNTATVEYELPHGGRRSDGTEITATLYCRVYRDLNKTQQVTQMVAVAQSLSSKRVLVCYPDTVDVTDLVDGSLTRVTDGINPEAAASQPGYYLSCAVGGQTAGNPPQQGFTRLGISGIDKVYNSSEYFTEEQLTTLSNGGVYVFVQDTANSLPYTIHEVTTDVSALEFAEYMTVKDYDYVAWTLLDIILEFIGKWNVTDDTIEFLRDALVTGGDTLKGRTVAKIGAPLTSYSITSLGASTHSSDRIEAYMGVGIPMVLNTIGLYLVA